MAMRSLFLALCAALLLTASAASGRPALQETVGSWPRATSFVLRDLSIPPTPRVESSRLTHAGILETRGYPAVVITLLCQSKGIVPQPGQIVLVLLPDEEWCLAALDREGHFLGAQFVTAQLGPGKEQSRVFFASPSERIQVAFPRYRMFLYNTTDRTAEVDLHATLTW